VPEGALLQFLETLDKSWHGLSVTMPLKQEAARLATRLDALASKSGIANTLWRDEEGWRGFNTDIFGVQMALRDSLIASKQSVVIIGSGATAISSAFAVLLANPLAEVRLIARNAQAAIEVAKLVGDSGFRIKTGSMSRIVSAVKNADIVISTLPIGALDPFALKLSRRFSSKPRGVFFDVAYNPWPSKFAAAWMSKDLTVVSGIEMLIFQAIAQLRVFTNGTVDQEILNERAVELAIRDSLGLI
jgi:shikimate dehydrogenase